VDGYDAGVFGSIVWRRALWKVLRDVLLHCESVDAHLHSDIRRARAKSWAAADGGVHVCCAGSEYRHVHDESVGMSGLAVEVDGENLRT
jgi:hypothetical protein